LKARAREYRPGDTDLSWTRLTPWRALLAAALDQYPAKIKSVVVESERNNPSADLLAAWLNSRLKVEVSRKISDGPGLTAVRMGTAAGDIAIARPDGLLASYAVPGQPERLVALKRRNYTELIEELRRMDPDQVLNEQLSRCWTVNRRQRAGQQSRKAQRRRRRVGREQPPEDRDQQGSLAWPPSVPKSCSTADLMSCGGAGGAADGAADGDPARLRPPRSRLPVVGSPPGRISGSATGTELSRRLVPGGAGGSERFVPADDRTGMPASP
jgi:hypothetical protein